MKRLFIIFSLLALFSCSKEEVFETDSSPLVKSMNTLSADLIDSISVTREAVLNLVDSLYGTVNTNIWVSNTPLGASDTLICNRIREAFSPDYVSWLVIVDKHPLANLGYEWRADNGMVAELQGYYFTNFVRMQRADINETYVSVDFYNPLGKQTTIVRKFVIQ